MNHQPEFAAHCINAAADKALIDGALAMTWTMADLAGDHPEPRHRLFGAQRT